MTFSIIKMKKHPIDDLFAQKLQDFEANPSQRAFDRFQERLAQKEKPKAGYWFWQHPANYGIAAGILLVVGLGWWVSTNKETETEGLAIASKEIPNVKIEDESRVLASAVSIGSPQAFLPKTTVKFVTNTPTKIVYNVSEGVDNEPVNMILDEPLKDELTLALENETNSVQSNLTEPSTNQDSIFKADIGETITILAQNLEEETILLPSLDADSPTTLANAEQVIEAKQQEQRTFIGKVFTELKHLKYGEKIDFSTLGIKKTVAFDDEMSSKEVIWNKVKKQIFSNE